MRAEGPWTQAGTPAVLARSKALIDAGTIDLSGVTAVDSAGVALMLELTRRARAAGKTLAFTGLPPNLMTLAAFFGVDKLLHLQQSAP